VVSSPSRIERCHVFSSVGPNLSHRSFQFSSGQVTSPFSPSEPIPAVLFNFVSLVTGYFECLIREITMRWDQLHMIHDLRPCSPPQIGNRSTPQLLGVSPHAPWTCRFIWKDSKDSKDSKINESIVKKYKALFKIKKIQNRPKCQMMSQTQEKCVCVCVMFNASERSWRLSDDSRFYPQYMSDMSDISGLCRGHIRHISVAKLAALGSEFLSFHASATAPPSAHIRAKVKKDS